MTTACCRVTAPQWLLNGILLLCDGKQHLDLDCLIQHTGLATSGDLLLHGALKDKSRCVFTGLIKIDATGQQTNSYLKNENLVLDRDARAMRGDRKFLFADLRTRKGLDAIIDLGAPSGATE
ncbi:MAG: hypothetical protein HC828_03415 [Blastochloris sp.]|nr:hypothetical protein [Blastochloris sp.]